MKIELKIAAGFDRKGLATGEGLDSPGAGRPLIADRESLSLEADAGGIHAG